MPTPAMRPPALVAQALAYEHGEGVAEGSAARRPRCIARRRATATPKRSTAWAGCTPTARRRARRRDRRVVLRAGRGSGPRAARKDARASSATRAAQLPDCMPIRPTALAAMPPTSLDGAGSVRRRCRRDKQKIADLVAQARAALRHRAAAGAGGHPRRIELRARRALAEGRARTDAAHSGDRGAVQGQRTVRHRATTSAAASRTCAGCSRTTRARWRWRPPRTTPARRPSIAIAAFRPIAETRDYVQRVLRCSAASASVRSARRRRRRRCWRCRSRRALGASHATSQRRRRCDAARCRAGARRARAARSGAVRARTVRRRSRGSSGSIVADRHVRAHAHAAVPVPRHGLRRRRRHARRHQRARAAARCSIPRSRETLAILMPGAGSGRTRSQVREATQVAVDPGHDLAVLRIDRRAAAGAAVRAIPTASKKDRTSCSPAFRSAPCSARFRPRIAA